MCTFATGRRPRGAALVIVMLVMSVLLLAGTTFLTISSTEDQIAENQHASVRAFLLAEAGLHRAVAQLSADETYSGEASVPLGGGTARIVVSVASQQVCLSKDVDVVATVPVRGGNAEARLRATADQAVYPFQWGFFAADGPLILASLDPSNPRSTADSYDSRLDSHVYPNPGGGGSVTIGARGGGVAVHEVDIVGGVVGALIAFPPVTQTISNTIGSPIDALPPLPEPPSVTWSADPNVPASATWILASGTYHYTNITLGAGARVLASGGSVTVYVRGDFQAGDNVTVGTEPGEKLSLVMNSGTGAPPEFRTGNGFRLYGSLYGANTTVLFGDSAVIHGSVIGRRISGASVPVWDGHPCCNQKAPTLHFDRTLTTRFVCTYSRFSIRRGTWREILP